MSQFKIATWNVNSLRVRLPHVIDWLTIQQPQVLALQETKLQNDDFPAAAFAELGYSVVFAGEKSYNGVAMLSRDTINDVVFDMPGYLDAQRRLIAATINNIRILNVYIPNGSSIDSDKFSYKLQWLTQLKQFIQQQLQQHSHLVLLGDFNMAPAAADVHDPQLWETSVLFHPHMRQVFQDFLQLGLQDTFRLFEQTPKSYSWWDYRMLALRRNHGLRIDHILASDALAKFCTDCSIDKTPRKLERPSDHAPVMAVFEV